MTACTNSREAVNCIVTERCRWQEERGQDGAAVDRKTTLQGSFSSGTARDGVVGSSPTGGAKIKTYHNRGRFLFCVFIPLHLSNCPHRNFNRCKYQ